MTRFDVQAATGYLEFALPNFLSDLESIVNVDSGTFDKAGVDLVAQALATRYVEMGLTVETVPDEKYGDTIVARLEGQGGRRILLLGHTDTVYPLGTARERPFTLDGGRASGPGVADMKSGDLAIVYALRALLDQGVRTFDRVTIVHNSDEEIGSPTSRDLIRTEAESADAVFVLEAGRENGDIVSARKGIADCRLLVEGVPAHAGVNHQRGRSAALELAHLVVGLEGINGRVPGVTLNVGRIEAGGRINVVPDRAVAHFEVRAFEIERLEEALSLAQTLVNVRTVEGTSATLTVSIEHYPMHKSSDSQRLVDLARTIGARLGVTFEDIATGGASDGNTAAAAGRPVLDGLGPVGGNAHSALEYIDVASIIPRTALLAGLIASAGEVF